MVFWDWELSASGLYFPPDDSCGSGTQRPANRRGRGYFAGSDGTGVRHADRLALPARLDGRMDRDDGRGGNDSVFYGRIVCGPRIDRGGGDQPLAAETGW